MARRNAADPTQTALAEIAEAKATGKVKLSIHCPSIEVARAVCDVTTLTDLRLSGELTELPDEIGNLVNLESLSLEQNKLTRLPAGFGKLTRLATLYCYSNKLVALPDEFGNLARLRKAVLWSNELTTLPRTIGRLVALTELDLKWNKLRSLPDEIGDLAALEELVLTSNELTALPRDLSGMKQLRRLRLGTNKLTEFPLGVLGLPSLRELMLGANQITAVPAEIARLTRLEELWLDGNAVTELPRALFSLPALTSLSAPENQITAIPREIGGLRSLATLDLEGNPIDIPHEVLELGKDAIFEHLGLLQPETIEGDLPPEPDRAAVVKEYQVRIDQFIRECKKRSHSAEMLPRIIDFITGKTSVVPPIRRDDHYGFSSLPKVLAPFPSWTFVDRRIIKYIAGPAWYYRQPGHDYFTGYYDACWDWLKPQLAAETDDRLFGAVAAMVMKETSEEVVLRSTLRELDDHMVRDDGTPTSYGRWVLAQAGTRLDVISEVAARYGGVRDAVLGLFIKHGFEMFTRIARDLLALKPDEDGELHLPYGAYDKLCAADPTEYVGLVLEGIERTDCVSCRAEAGRVLIERCGPDHRARGFAIAIRTLSEISERRNTEDRYHFSWSGARYDGGAASYVDWVLRTFGDKARDGVFSFAENTKVFDLDVAEAIARHLGQVGVDALAEGLNMRIEDDDIAAHFRRMFTLLAPLDWSRYHDKAWEIVRSEYRQVRQTACLAVSRLDPAQVLPRALALIGEKKAHLREAGVLIATLLPGDPAAATLDRLLASEPTDDVRDLVVARRFAEDTKITIAEAGKRAASAAARGKLERPVAKWLDEKRLGAGGVVWKTGKPVDHDTVRFLLHRQTRTSDIAPEAEVRAIYPLIDRARSSGFATKLLAMVMRNGGASAKNRFALSVIGMVGDDAVIETLEKVAIEGRNENAATTLGLLGTTEAARALDRVMTTFRIKYPNVREAAQDAFDRIAATMGVTRFELADTMIPDFGFKPGTLTRTIGSIKATATITVDRKLQVVDAKGKPIKLSAKTVPAKDRETIEELRDAVDSAARVLRASLEYYMVSGRRWPAERWRAFFLANPLAFALAQTLVWGVHDSRGLTASFRVTPSGALVDVRGGAVAPGKTDSIALLHPLELEAGGRAAWQVVLEAAGVKPPFAQMTRPVFIPKDDDRAKTMSFEFESKELSGLTFKSRAERLGWRRGSVVDSGAVSAYRKAFPRQQIEAFIGTDNLGVTSFDDSEASLKELFFVKAGSVVTGSYTYDEPREGDQRLLRLGDVPTIVYSETIADLRAVTRTADAAE